MKQDYDALTALMLGENTQVDSESKIVYQPMNEVYLGGSAVAGIQSVMDQIVQALTDDPSTIMARNPLTKKLENEVQKAFGFKRVRIEWKSGSGLQAFSINVNPTIGNYGAEKFKHMKNSSFKQGSHKNGFYDKDHVASVYIYMDTIVVTEYNCTSREMVSMLLHEIGHSFDYTPARMISDVYNIGKMLINITSTTKSVKKIAGEVGKQDQMGGFFAGVISKAAEIDMIKQMAMIPISSLSFTKDVMMSLSMVREYILSYMPPIQSLARTLRTTKAKVIKFLIALHTPLRIGNAVSSIIGAFSSPKAVIFAPINWIFSILTKQREIYADSFAATYGYAEDLSFAMHKISRGNAIPNVNKGFQAFSGFYDLAYCQSEIITMFSQTSKHPAKLKRILRMIDKLERDLNTNNVDPELRAELQVKLKELQKTYDAIVNMDETNYTFISTLFTKIMTAYYNSDISTIADFDSSFAE